jgi:peptidoglycan/xylan/chitin deacetylase (PgdA/CDA1 family)
MNKHGTWAAAGGVATGLAGLGYAAGRRSGTQALAAATAAAAGGLYLVGTFSPKARIFGATAMLPAGTKAFALTFDDGPDPRFTPALSRMLAERGHRATFFVLGRSVRAHPEVAAAVLEDGHELGCHGDDHQLLAFASPAEIRRQIAATESAVLEATGAPPVPLFRPPHGVRSPWLTPVVERLGYRVCAWDGAVFDTAEPGVEAIVARVASVLAPGAVVLLHDGDGSGHGASRQQTVDAVPAILDAAKDRGLSSIRASACW